MKTFPLLILALLVAHAGAEPPKKAPLPRYAQLWANSPFTNKPPPGSNAPEVNPLEDYALGGVSPIPGGYRVTLLNRKKPEERIVLPNSPEFPDFHIESVHYATGDPLGTKVRIRAGNKLGDVPFDPTLLTLKAAPAPQAQPPQNPNQAVPNPVGAPGVPGQQAANGTIPPPRPRVAPTAPNGNPAQPNGVIPGQQQQQQRPQILRPNNPQRQQRH